MGEKLAVPVGDKATTLTLYRAEKARAALYSPRAPARRRPSSLDGVDGEDPRRSFDRRGHLRLPLRPRRQARARPASGAGATWRAAIARGQAGATSATRRLYIEQVDGRPYRQHGRRAGDEPIGRVDGLVLLGYPLHPPGKPLELRVEHLPRNAAPVLFVQGSRDVRHARGARAGRGGCAAGTRMFYRRRRGSLARATVLRRADREGDGASSRRGCPLHRAMTTFTRDRAAWRRPLRRRAPGRRPATVNGPCTASKACPRNRWAVVGTPREAARRWGRARA